MLLTVSTNKLVGDRMSFTIKVFSEHMKIDAQQIIKAIEQRYADRPVHSLTFLSEDDLVYLAEMYKQNKLTAKVEPSKPVVPQQTSSQPETGNQGPTSAEREQSAMRNLENAIKNADIIMIDACSLLHDKGIQFFHNLRPVLQKYTKELAIPQKVSEELKIKGEQTKDIPLQKKALKIRYEIKKAHEQGLVEVYGDPSIDTFADGVFLMQIQRLRLDRSVLLITNDIVLGKEVLSMNTSRAARGKEIKVMKVSNYAYLQRVYEDNNSTAPQRDSKPLTNKPQRTVAANSFQLATKVIQATNEPLSYKTDITENTVVYDEQRQMIRLGKELGKGGEGSVFATATPGIVAKIYKKDRITREKLNKLKLMISKPPTYPGICYPQKLLYDSRGDFIGYTMPHAQGKELKRKLFVPKKEIEKTSPHFKRSDLVAITIDILDKIEYLHKHNIILGDINPFNILVDDQNKVYFVDVDSYQVEGYPCPVGTLIYTAPEIQGKHYPTFLRTFGHEHFAIATLIFTIQFLGKSPYDQTGSESGAQNIQNMDFPYTFKQDDRAENTPKGQWRIIWYNLSYPMRKAFYETFQKDEAHATEQTRMNVTQWRELLARYYADLTTGKFVQDDEVVNEVFPNRYRINRERAGELKNCRVCNQSFQERALNKGICHRCLNLGDEYTCAGPGCSKELVHTNFEKHVRGITTRFKYCKECNTMMRRTYRLVNCATCNEQFKITYDDKYYYEGKGQVLPTRCRDCRRNKHQQTTAPRPTQSQPRPTTSQTARPTQRPSRPTPTSTQHEPKKESIVSIWKKFFNL